MTTLTNLQPAPVIDETVRLLTEHYVFPEIAKQLADLPRQRLAEGAYDVDSAEELARLVTADLQSVSDDKHLRLKYHADPVSPGEGAATLESIRRDFDTSLGGAPRVELLDGGVVVVELAPMLFPLDRAAEPLSAALTLASRARALIVDLRGNPGRRPGHRHLRLQLPPGRAHPPQLRSPYASG
ncbi:hypothetical protein ACU635_08630 [[Actinomadura] parvosata]|uniref:hypothetical protein n=1 Tax=[Actinomadura] parvosata TaxID=1955412 RepID=UPI00406C52C2